MKKFLIKLLYENGEPSRAGLISVIAFLAFLAGSAYLMITGQQWAHYDTFAACTGGGGIGGILGNKYINNKLGSATDQPFIKNNGGNA